MKSDINKAKLKAIKDTIRENKKIRVEVVNKFYNECRDIDNERRNLEKQITNIILDWARKPINIRHLIKNISTRPNTDEVSYYQCGISHTLSTKFGRGNRDIVGTIIELLVDNKFITRLVITDKAKVCKTMTTCDNCEFRYACLFNEI